MSFRRRGTSPPHGETEDHEVRKVTTRIIMELKGDGIPVDKSLVKRMLEDRLKIERNFKYIGRMIRTQWEVKTNRGHRTKIVT